MHVVPQVLHEMGVTRLELFSFHSSSKGLSGECGVRGGLVQCENVRSEVSTCMGARGNGSCTCVRALTVVCMASGT